MVVERFANRSSKRVRGNHFRDESTANYVKAANPIRIINPPAVARMHEKYREDSSTFEIPYFVAKFVAKVGEPDVATASHPILIPVKLSSQP
ncbi:hypothetical protein AVEN_175025-1 [Araneus ventricosus]|uniref:Uncharacterized protein n=1 Tax=Araneus ventricosus TaxID=182803 RepID=A0A4Y2GLH3_ARAVE|nr:hypothetical protein AVEN_175025-1 [Araneus ventricosus]